MSEYLPVPVQAAKFLSERFRKSMVVILSFDPEFELTHCTSYGVQAFDKEQAAAIGERCVQEVCGGDLSRKVSFEDFHHNMDPARLREAQELLAAVAEVDNPVISRGLLARIRAYVSSSPKPENCKEGKA